MAWLLILLLIPLQTLADTPTRFAYKDAYRLAIEGRIQEALSIIDAIPLSPVAPEGEDRSISRSIIYSIAKDPQYSLCPNV